LNTAALNPLYDSRIEKRSLRKRGKVGEKNTATIYPLYDSRKSVFEKRSRKNTDTSDPLQNRRISVKRDGEKKGTERRKVQYG